MIFMEVVVFFGLIFEWVFDGQSWEMNELDLSQTDAFWLKF